MKTISQKSKLLKILFLLTVLCFIKQNGFGQNTISLTTIGTAYTQDFNTLANTGTANITPNGWYFIEVGTASNPAYNSGTGSSTTGDTYSFGSAALTERAFGMLQSGSLISTIGAAFTNNTGSTITSLEIIYYGEEWRFGATSRLDEIDFQYSLDANSLNTGTWTPVTALNYVTTNTSISTGAVDGNALANRTLISATISALSIANGSNFWIRWNDFNATGSDDGLAVDDFTLTPQATVACVLPFATLSNNSLLCSSETLSLNANVTGTTSSILWQGPNGFTDNTQNPVISNVSIAASGVYTLMLSNSCGTFSATTTATVISQPSITANSATICSGNSVIIVPSGVNNYTLTNGLSTNMGNSFTLNPNSLTSYSITGTTTGGCAASNTAVITISVNAAPNVSINLSSPSLTVGQSVTLTATGADSYSWSTTSASSVIIETPNSTISYTVIGTSLNSCSAVAVAEVTVQNFISLTALCLAYVQDFNTLASAGASSVMPLGWFFEESGSNAGTTYLAGTGSGSTGDTYSFGSATLTTDRAFGSLVSSNLSSTIGAVFANNTGSTITFIEINYYGEEWRFGATGRTNLDSLYFEYSLSASSLTTTSGWIAVPGLNFKTPDIIGNAGLRDGNASGFRTMLTATVSVSIPNGSIFWIRWNDPNIAGTDDGLAIDDFTLTPQMVPPPAATIVAPTGLCEGTNLNLNANTSGLIDTYYWQGPNSFTALVQNPTISGASPAALGNYTLTVTSGCRSFYTTTLIAVDANPTITANSAAICENASGVITPSGAATYTISGGSFTVSPNTLTSYSITGESANGCLSTNTAVVTVSINALPTVSVNSGIICSGSVFTITPSGANVYSYSSGSTTVSPTNTTTPTSYSITGISLEGCPSSNTAVATVSVNALPNIIVNSATICSGDVFTITPSGAGTNGTYTISGGSNTVMPMSNISYSVIGTSSAGCVASNIAVAIVSVNVAPIVNAISSDICVGQTALILCAGADTYTINGNPAGFIYTVTPTPTQSATYTVLGSNAFGCVGSALVIIQVHPTPTITATGGQVCKGLNFVIATSGANTYIVLPNLSTTVTPSTTTTYSVTGLSADGCEGNTVAVTVTVNSLPSLTIIASPSVICATSSASVTLSASGASAYVWDTGDHNATITLPHSSSATAYSVEGTDTQGCTNTSTVIVVIDPCTGIGEFKDENIDLKIYPNPNNGMFTVEAPENTRIVVMNGFCQIVYERIVISNKTEITLKEFANGIYFVKTIYNNTQQTFKMIKQ